MELPQTHYRSPLLPVSLRRLLASFSVVLLLLITSQSFGDEPAKAARMSDYRLGTGDKISIKVYDEEELSLEAIVPSSGSISYPFLKEVKLAGKTVTEVETAIRTGLQGDYLIDPKVSVTVLVYRQFYIHGEVKYSGGYAYQPDLTLRKAITLAGGFTDKANKSKITVIRDGDKRQGSQKIGLDDLVSPGDIITVEESLF